MYKNELLFVSLAKTLEWLNGFTVMGEGLKKNVKKLRKCNNFQENPKNILFLSPIQCFLNRMYSQFKLYCYSIKFISS